MAPPNPVRLRVAALSGFALILTIWAFKAQFPLEGYLAGGSRRTQSRIQEAIREPLAHGEFPEILTFSTDSGSFTQSVAYTLNFELQKEMERFVRLWKPDYAAFVALDARRGRVLCLVSFTRQSSSTENLALRSTFPAASLFKLVTATAAIDQGILTPNTLIAFNGANHTLYRRNVTSDQVTRWTRRVTLKEAFALSINTVFGKVGMHQLEDSHFKQYADRYLFNRSIPGDVPVAAGNFALRDGDAWSRAEVASGFNSVVSISPVQAALMAGAVANDGVMMAPHVVSSLLPTDPTGSVLADSSPVYLAEPAEASVVMRPETAADLKELMRETVRRGTARAAFRRGLEGIEIGGKTGSLRGKDPVGTNDWFMGYAINGDERVSVGALTVNIEKWRVKSAAMASYFFRYYFSRQRAKD